MQIETAKDLSVYKLAYELAMEILMRQNRFRRTKGTLLRARSDVHQDLFA